jgi:hypothetical protein
MPQPSPQRVHTAIRIPANDDGPSGTEFGSKGAACYPMIVVAVMTAISGES